MTPYLALARSAPAPSPPPRPGEADVSSDRLSSIVGPEPKSASQQFAKTKMTTSPAAAAPTRRLEQVAPPQSSRESARLARARDGSESVERCQIPMIVQCRSRRSAARARASPSSVSAADFPICCHDPIPRFSSIGAGTSAAAPSRRSRRQHRSPQLHRRPRTGICPTTIPQKRNDDVASSRSADQAARAGRSASELAESTRASCARERAASKVDAAKFR